MPEAPRSQDPRLVVELWEACQGGIPPVRFMALLTNGLTPETTADLPPDLVATFATRRADLGAALTADLGEPPDREHWRFLATTLAAAVAGPRDPDDLPSEAGDDPCLELWEYCELWLDPFEFAAFWRTGELSPYRPSLARSLLEAARTRARQAVEKNWREAVNRPPTDEEWAGMFNLEDHYLTFSNGALGDRDLYSCLVETLWETCPKTYCYDRFAGLLTDGLTPEAAAALPPDVARDIAEQREYLAQLMTDDRDSPPEPDDWLLLAETVFP